MFVVKWLSRLPVKEEIRVQFSSNTHFVIIKYSEFSSEAERAVWGREAEIAKLSTPTAAVGGAPDNHRINKNKGPKP